MCGIAGYIGKQQAAPIILDGLSKLEYRGYDSAGLAVYDGERIHMEKAAGRLRVLEELTQHGATMPGLCGIGHTRWATHGSPSDTNAHPHLNENSSIAVVHNGIIENYAQLRQRLQEKGYHFASETDTEVLAHMLTEYYDGDPVEAIEKVMHRVEAPTANSSPPTCPPFCTTPAPSTIWKTKKSPAFLQSTPAFSTWTESPSKKRPSPLTGISTRRKKAALNILCSRRSMSSPGPW